MPLPDLIEIVPLIEPARAAITVPGSKSITNRALVLAALAEGETVLEGALWSEDTQVMVECLQELGFMINVAPDPRDVCNRTITVYGQGGTVPRGGTAEQPLELFVGNAGTAARFLTALTCLGEGAYRLHGVARMHERPQGALINALRELGYRIDSLNARLPVMVHGRGPRPGRCAVSIQESSQFASALLLSAKAGGWTVAVTGENAEESPYVTMTHELIAAFPVGGGAFRVEPDASSGSYFWAAGEPMPGKPPGDAGTEQGPGVARSGRAQVWSVQVRDWPTSTWQIDARFPQVLASLFTASPEQPAGIEPVSISRSTDLGDSIMTAIVLAPLATRPIHFTHLGRLRVQECERVLALRTELARCGARVIETGDTLAVSPSPLHGAEIETYDDHRMAMCFAILGLKVPGIKIKNPACVKKTFPNFFQKLSGPPPAGLGAIILDATTGQPLALHELFAE